MSWFFQDSIRTQKLNKILGFDVNIIEKQRLVKLVSKKTGKFKAWTVTTTSTVDTSNLTDDQIDRFNDWQKAREFLFDCMEEYNHLVESVIFDYTGNGDFFALTSEDKERALTKKTNIYGS